jgi:hypothetical protein
MSSFTPSANDFHNELLSRHAGGLGNAFGTGYLDQLLHRHALQNADLGLLRGGFSRREIRLNLDLFNWRVIRATGCFYGSRAATSFLAGSLHGGRLAKGREIGSKVQMRVSRSTMQYRGKSPQSECLLFWERSRSGLLTLPGASAGSGHQI